MGIQMFRCAVIFEHEVIGVDFNMVNKRLCVKKFSAAGAKQLQTGFLYFIPKVAVALGGVAAAGKFK